jgi:hypothetical protein
MESDHRYKLISLIALISVGLPLCQSKSVKKALSFLSPIHSSLYSSEPFASYFFNIYSVNR